MHPGSCFRSSRPPALALLVLSLVASGCSSQASLPWLPGGGEEASGGEEGASNGNTDEPCQAMADEISIGPSDRPALLRGPAGWCANHPIDVVFLLHGYSASAESQDFLLRLGKRIEPDHFLLILPDGTFDISGRRFWNGPPGCCDFYGSGVDDVGYLSGLIDQIDQMATINGGKVYFTGHSNGGFMSYRMACERPESIHGIASLAGSGYPEAEDCSSTEPVSVLQIHGELDSTIYYLGAPTYPGAVEVTERWAARAGCDVDEAHSGQALNLVNNLTGDETEVLNYNQGCDNKQSASLWTITNGPHVPLVNDSFATHVVEWLRAH